MRILFSPVGMTDPLSHNKKTNEFNEGALLQICRYYRPDIVYVYMSKEAVDFENTDHRYGKGLELLKADTDQSFEVRKIVRPELVDVHLFDYFLDEFKDLIKIIRAEYPEAEILANVSSGTPAMKSALQILAAATDLNIKPLQVSTPNERSNNPRPCNISEEWEKNLDKSPDSPNRVEVSSNKNLLFEFNKKLLISLINSYDYHTAGMLADSMKPFLSSQFCDMLNAVILRYDLKTDEAKKCFAACGHGELIKKNNLAAEYYMLLELKVRKKEYTDFLRAFTPLVLEVFYDMAKKSLNVDLTRFTTAKNKYYWSENKLLGSKLDGKFDQQIKYHSNPRPMQEGSFPKKYVLSWHISNLTENLSRDEQLVEKTIKIRKFEEDVRNLAAHTMTSFTEDQIVEETGIAPVDMMKELLDYIRTYTTIPVDESSLSAYDDMNKILIELLG